MYQFLFIIGLLFFIIAKLEAHPTVKYVWYGTAALLIAAAIIFCLLPKLN